MPRKGTVLKGFFLHIFRRKNKCWTALYSLLTADYFECWEMKPIENLTGSFFIFLMLKFRENEKIPNLVCSDKVREVHVSWSK